MDISKWLDDTEQPDFPSDSSTPAHPRRRATSDSSLLEPLAPKAPSRQHDARPQTASHARHAAPSECSNASRYARKPRRKTRPDRYEPNVHHRRRRNTSPKKPQHKSARSNKEKPGVVVQSFRAKNVSRDRLTLKPPDLGLFSKGRASMAVRGRGLPDLVFSEMKFLHQHNHPKPPLQPDMPKKRKKEHIQTAEGEISAFFTSECLAPAGQAGKGPSRQSSMHETERRRRDPLSMTDAVVPTVELADQESSVAVENRRPRHDSTGYVSWSESIRAPSTTPARLQADHDTARARHDPERYRPYASNVNRESSSKPPFAKQSADEVAERFRVSSLAPRSQVCRSQSCPQYSSSPRRLDLASQSEKPQSADAACLPSSMPPALPNQRLSASRPNTRESGTSPNFDHKAHPHKQHQIVDGECTDWDESETSSDLAKVLQECKDTFQEKRWAASPQTRDTARPEPLLPTPRVTQQDQTSSHPSTRRMPTVRFAELPCQYQILPYVAGRSIYEQQEQRQYARLGLSGNGGRGVDAWALEQEYMDEHDGLHSDGDNGWEPMLEEAMAHGSRDDNGIYLAVDDITEDYGSGSDVVAPGFWRPNRLY
ncbi:hypothetical protein ACJQWK_05632 [Exserohilum turcicum]|uniref:Uncharacterized protein n=1 Tax=Exserohilum turcicum (strain 28A) TaxID=671987 RepID=R0KLS5_EXST2|nr:uncharacterized protein SETTUDRAFT_46474 [Exserohilum turcica Et28A]EOA88902.1 hypothetical protein SETTUDRAFT_46474 [Exserohilum turcica Et28A]